VRFEWDPFKAAAHVRAHRVTFAEAVTVFEDDFALMPCLSTSIAGQPSMWFDRQSGRNSLPMAPAGGLTSGRSERAERAADRGRVRPA
jgi:hypothetical protein